MKPTDKHLIKEALRKTKWAEKNKTGKKATKKQLSETLNHIIKFLPKEEKKENWKEQIQPKSIKDILRR